MKVKSACLLGWDSVLKNYADRFSLFFSFFACKNLVQGCHFFFGFVVSGI
jgi:hypothetical protein